MAASPSELTVLREMSRKSGCILLVHMEERRMPPVLIVCPITEDIVPTGVDVESIEELTTNHLLIACPQCGRDHDWTPADAVLSSA